MLFKQKVFYIQFFENKIVVRDVRTQQVVVHNTILRYANDRLLIANFYNAESELRSAIQKIQKKSIFSGSTVFIFQPFHNNIKEYTEVEQRTFFDSCMHAGAKRVYVYYGSYTLEQPEIKNILSNKVSVVFSS